MEDEREGFMATLIDTQTVSTRYPTRNSCEIFLSQVI